MLVLWLSKNEGFQDVFSTVVIPQNRKVEVLAF